MAQYLALLRGINLGKRRIKMAALRKDFEEWGFTAVRTLLASGNVVFESAAGDPAKVQAKIEQGFIDRYGWEVPACVRRRPEILDLVEGKPFEGVEDAKHIQKYVTFLAEPPEGDLGIPYSALDGDYRILDVQPGHVISVLDRSQERGTLDAMAVLEKEFGDAITTRNWSTVLKAYELMKTDG